MCLCTVCTLNADRVEPSKLYGCARLLFYSSVKTREMAISFSSRRVYLPDYDTYEGGLVCLMFAIALLPS